jgi:predicted negative regulator of RcsB-dependent stress response
VNVYETDEEKVEALKKWWKENGLSVAAGIGIGLAAVFGWRGWIGYQDSVGQQASAAFEQVLAAVDSGNKESAIKQSELLEEQGSKAYTAFADLVRARLELETGDTAEARAALEQAIANAPDPALARIAALRLTRVLIDSGDLAEATAVIAKHDNSESFAGDFAALRGDIAAAEGRIQDARDAYEQALATGTALPELTRLKLDNLPSAG